MDDQYSLRDVAQPRCDDVVVAAAAFGPNAAGRRELSSIRGMSERQVLKSRASFLADRVLLAVTPLEVIAMALGPISSRFREVLRWKRDSIVIRGIESHARVANILRPAFLIGSPWGPRLELAAIAQDDNTRRVLTLLFDIGRPHTVSY
jgi:hypothetical protein